MKLVKISVLVAVLLAMAFSPVWAGGSGQKTGGETTMRFSYWGGDARIAIYNQIVARYTEDNPGIKITLEPSSFNDYFNKLSTQLAGGAAADVISMHPRYLKYYSSSGALFRLNDYCDKGTIDVSDFSRAGLGIGRISDNIWMISTGTVAHGLFINETIFQELGIPLSRFDNIDWEGYVNLAIEVSQKSNGKYYGTNDESFSPNDVPLAIFMRTRGKDYFGPDGKVGFNRQDLIDYLTLFDRLRNAKAVPDAQRSGESLNQTWEQGNDVKGIVGFWFLNANRLRIFQEQMPNVHLVMRRAPVTNGRHGEYLDGSGISINVKTPYKDQAAHFINYWINNQRSMELFKIEHGFPASARMNAWVFNLLDASNKLASQFMDEVNSGGVLSDYVLPPDNWQDIQNALAQETQAIAYGTKTIEKAVDDFFATVAKL
jgi:multiple sugar transport system substrate-binding protein